MLPADEIKNLLNQTPIIRQMDKITSEEVILFRSSTQTDHADDIPPTFATKYRHGEFDWLKRAGVTLKEVLHAEQEYEYLLPLKVGDAPKISTTLTGFKERRGMAFFVLEATVFVGTEAKVRVSSSFVVRDGVKQ